MILLDAVRAAMPPAARPPRPPRHVLLLERVDRVGRATAAAVLGLGRIISFFGQVMAGFAGMALRPWRFRFTSLVFHMQETGLNAVPIVALMSFLIGIVIAYQGADQLRQFGAEVFVVDLIAISVLRELGILLDGHHRGGAVGLGVYGGHRVDEDARRGGCHATLGLDPVQVLVLPRVLALLLMLPALAVVADLAGLLGGGLMAWFTLGISPGMFQTRLLDTDVSHFVIGVVKAPFFAMIIGVVGCFQGLQVQGNAESLGQLTSRSVVQAIFVVILADATFSILFAAAGV